MRKTCLALQFCCCLSILHAQSPEILRIRSVTDNSKNVWLKEYTSFLSIPNTANHPSGLQQSAQFIIQMMKNRGISNVRLLTVPDTKVPPAVYGEVNTPGATSTITFYAHYDGQPVDSSQWAKGLQPFVPVLMSDAIEKGGKKMALPSGNVLDGNWRLYARGASDDKAGVMAILNAYAAIRKAGLPVQYNLRFFFEGEEEAGSTHLPDIFQAYSSLLKSDLWVICDGPVHQSGKKQISFGVRGDAHVSVTVYGPARPLHSGHYGNWAPNPGLMLAKLLASMKDDNGRVTIRGFYADVKPLTELEKQALQVIPPVTQQLKEELKFTQEEMPGVDLQDAILLPSLNINGMQSGNVGAKASNVIPTSASAVLDLRLVPGVDYRVQQKRVLEHIREQGYYILDEEPTDLIRSSFAKIARVHLSEGYNAQRTPMDLPAVQKVIGAVRSTTDDKVVLIPSMGGSLPLYMFEKYLGVPTITVPVANHDNNQHAENENIRLQNLWNGIETFAAIMMMR
jgi:acetylornithine deacetylase/succinyl-diaminopimelate desuccinylase-like protein